VGWWMLGAGGVGAGGDLTLNGVSVGSTATPLMLGSVGGWLYGNVTGGALTAAYNVKSLGSSTINLGLVTAVGPTAGVPVTIDATGGSILHVHSGTDITAGRVNFWGGQIGTFGFDLEVTTDNPPVYCNGVPCGLPYFVNGTTRVLVNIITNVQADLVSLLLQQGNARLLTSGVLPTNVFACLNDEDEPVVCTAEGVWDDKKADAKALQPNGSDPDTAETLTPRQAEIKQENKFPSLRRSDAADIARVLLAPLTVRAGTALRRERVVACCQPLTPCGQGGIVL